MIAHYDQQTDDEGAAEIELAPEAEGETWMSVPWELVGEVTRLIESHERKNGASSRKHTKKPRVTKK